MSSPSMLKIRRGCLDYNLVECRGLVVVDSGKVCKAVAMAYIRILVCSGISGAIFRQSDLQVPKNH